MNFGNNEFTHAVVLNNLACKLLEHGALRESFETFGDALASYRESMLRDGGDGTKARIRLDAAAARLGTENLTKTSIVRVVNLGEDDLVNLQADAQFGKFMFCAFRLACASNNNTSPRCLRDTEFDSAIILYNYGMAHISILKYGFRERKAFKDASRLMRFALGVLNKEMKTKIRRGQAMNNHEFLDLSTICKIMTTNYSYIIAKRGRYAEARQCYDDMEEFLLQHPHHQELPETIAAAA